MLQADDAADAVEGETEAELNRGELAEHQQQQRPALAPPGSFVVRMPIALIDTGPNASSSTPAYSPASVSKNR